MPVLIHLQHPPLNNSQKPFPRLSVSWVPLKSINFKWTRGMRRLMCWNDPSCELTTPDVSRVVKQSLLAKRILLFRSRFHAATDELPLHHPTRALELHGLFDKIVAATIGGMCPHSPHEKVLYCEKNFPNVRRILQRTESLLDAIASYRMEILRDTLVNERHALGDCSSFEEYAAKMRLYMKIPGATSCNHLEDAHNLEDEEQEVFYAVSNAMLKQTIASLEDYVDLLTWGF
ncbi:hypothetical protein BJ508DRAFT_311341 [Ascobolus immersus RN42]|uniref:Uncharacterized protein n=1 Tax=Ascobolus immersus RN42 TaxID=1160509 RepID=A0A3N4HQL7_ASCIM|nr:hypothetical protein BJ508DRAFT_311341 [Ascobolus immersus RN42]